MKPGNGGRARHIKRDGIAGARRRKRARASHCRSKKARAFARARLPHGLVRKPWTSTTSWPKLRALRTDRRRRLRRQTDPASVGSRDGRRRRRQIFLQPCVRLVDGLLIVNSTCGRPRRESRCSATTILCATTHELAVRLFRSPGTSRSLHRAHQESSVGNSGHSLNASRPSAHARGGTSLSEPTASRSPAERVRAMSRAEHPPPAAALPPGSRSSHQPEPEAPMPAVPPTRSCRAATSAGSRASTPSAIARCIASAHSTFAFTRRSVSCASATPFR